MRRSKKENLLGIDVQTKHIYNLIEIGKKGTKTTLTVNFSKPISQKINLLLYKVNIQITISIN
jgi:hypothetical protein